MTSTQPEKSDDGGDVARDPDVIQREIEQTRAELADTIDAIADRLSPKRAAARGAKAVKAQVSSVLDRADADATTGTSTPDGGGPVLAAGGIAQQRRLRPDRVIMIVAGVAVVGTGVMVWRSRHR
jgi:hypothetical protein